MLDYNRLATDYARYRKTHPHVLASLLRSIKGTQTRVLEVGCGTANYLAALAEIAGCGCAGIDPSEEMLARARDKAVPMALTLGRAEQLPFAGGSFDVVFSVDVIHHVQDRAQYYREAFRVLSPGGVVCTVTDSEWVIRRRRPLTSHFPETVAAELGRYPSADSLKTMMDQAGFSAIAEETVEFAYQLTDIAPYRNKAFSSLHLISEEAFRAGIDRLERDLKSGPIDCRSLYTVIWGTRA
ncbi:MAG: class I SAM-dependent methyltransferase [Chloroflexota bacterium]